MKPDHCGNCRFWDPSTEGLHAGQIGDCRRSAPRIDPVFLARTLCPPVYGLDCGRKSGHSELVESAVYEASAFPMSHRESWCGEYARKGRP